MPPISGIINIKRSAVDQRFIDEINSAKQYICARDIINLEEPGIYLSSAISAGGAYKKEIIFKKNDYIIIADASLYNREELIIKLNYQKNDLSVISDSRLILDSFFKWGENFLNHLYGDFAFIIFNNSTGNILCARDPVGIRPLFYTIYGDNFIFASELRYIKSVLNQKNIRQEYLLNTLIRDYEKKDCTPFKDIFRLMPGNILKYLNNRWESKRYFKFETERKIFQSEKQYTESFTNKLINAIQIRCNLDESIGSELSGGLDSSSIAIIAEDYLKLNNKDLTAFSNLFPNNIDGHIPDERKYIDAIVQFKDLKCEEIVYQKASIIELLKFAIDIQGCFTQQIYSVFNRALYEKASEKNINILLSGFGGDEFASGGFKRNWKELILNNKLNVIIDELFYRGLSKESLIILLKILLNYFGLKLGKFKKERLINKWFNALNINPEFAKTMNLREIYCKDIQEKIKSKLMVSQEIPDYVSQRLEYSYTAAAQYGIEYRYPLLDVDLINYSLAIPEWMRYHHNTNRYIFRQSISSFVPEIIYNRNSKAGNTIPYIYNNLINGREDIMEVINKAFKYNCLNMIFNLKEFTDWYERLIIRNKKELRFLRATAFYSYLMIMIYYIELEEKDC